jgi:hypothetical protein
VNFGDEGQARRLHASLANRYQRATEGKIMIETLKEIQPHVTLKRDTDTGIAFVDNGSAGVRHTVHPNIDASGSVRGMVSLGYWNAADRTVQAGGFIYNIDRYVADDDLDKIAGEHCQCGGQHA